MIAYNESPSQEQQERLLIELSFKTLRTISAWYSHEAGSKLGYKGTGSPSGESFSDDAGDLREAIESLVRNDALLSEEEKRQSVYLIEKAEKLLKTVLLNA